MISFFPRGPPNCFHVPPLSAVKIAESLGPWLIPMNITGVKHSVARLSFTNMVSWGCSCYGTILYEVAIFVSKLIRGVLRIMQSLYLLLGTHVGKKLVMLVALSSLKG